MASPSHFYAIQMKCSVIMATSSNRERPVPGVPGDLCWSTVWLLSKWRVRKQTTSTTTTTCGKRDLGEKKRKMFYFNLCMLPLSAFSHFFHSNNLCPGRLRIKALLRGHDLGLELVRNEEKITIRSTFGDVLVFYGKDSLEQIFCCKHQFSKNIVQHS